MDLTTVGTMGMVSTIGWQQGSATGLAGASRFQLAMLPLRPKQVNRTVALGRIGSSSYL
jgi:hypothetical protein